MRPRLARGRSAPGAGISEQDGSAHVEVRTVTCVNRENATSLLQEPPGRSAVRLLAVPYDSGHRGKRQGLGPANLIEHWLASPEVSSRLPEVVWVESATDFPTEVATTFELMGRVADEAVSYTHLRAHETVLDLVCRLLLEK